MSQQLHRPGSLIKASALWEESGVMLCTCFSKAKKGNLPWAEWWFVMVEVFPWGKFRASLLESLHHSYSPPELLECKRQQPAKEVHVCLCYWEPAGRHPVPTVALMNSGRRCSASLLQMGSSITRREYDSSRCSSPPFLFLSLLKLVWHLSWKCWVLTVKFKCHLVRVSLAYVISYRCDHQKLKQTIPESMRTVVVGGLLKEPLLLPFCASSAEVRSLQNSSFLGPSHVHGDKAGWGCKRQWGGQPRHFAAGKVNWSLCFWGSPFV